MTDIRELEQESIRAFVQKAADNGLLSGKVLDLGCGARPYQRIIEEARGDYFGHDDPSYPGALQFVKEQHVMKSVYYGTWDPLDEAGAYDAVLCTQVIQYVTQAHHVWLARIRGALRSGGVLLATGPTSWPIIETDDLFRHTPAGIGRLLSTAGFSDFEVEARGRFSFGGDDRWCVGWQAVARA